MKIPIVKIDTSNRGRKNFGDLTKLSESIKAHGLIHPIVVEENEGSYILIAGERRLRATLQAGKTEIEASLRKDTSDEELKLIELEENVQRKDLSWAEQCEILRQLDELKRRQLGDASTSSKVEGGFSRRDLADFTGRSVGSVTQDLKLADAIKKSPDIAKEIRHLPKAVALKRLKVLEEEARLRKVKSPEQLQSDIVLRNGPCEKLIEAIPDASIDCLITDPPYACETMNETGKLCFGSSYARDLNNMGTAGSMDAVYDKLFPELKRVLKPGAHCYIFHAMESNHDIKMRLRALDFTVDDMPIIWYKMRGTNKPTDWHYIPCYETVIFAIKNPRGRPLMKPRNNVIECQPLSSAARIHPLQKPEDVIRIFIENSTSMGQTILDPFAGSGSTLLAAKHMHRHAIGFELSESNYLFAKETLKCTQT